MGEDGRLAGAWASYERDAVPADASPAERGRLRLAFQAGASAMLDALAAADAGPEGDDEAADAIRREVEGFDAAVRDGLGGWTQEAN